MGRIVVVTGANRGIGLEVAKRLNEKDFDVIMGCRDVLNGFEAVISINGKKEQVFELDVASDESVSNFVKEIGTRYGHVDVLVNNAGIMLEDDYVGKLTESSMDMLKTTFETNYFGVFRMVTGLRKLMEKSTDPRIINVSSTLGSLSSVGEFSPCYSTSKTAVNSLTVRAADELPGWKVNSVCPGWVRTRMGTEAAPLSVVEGADTIIWLVETDDSPTGKFLRNREPIPW